MEKKCIVVTGGAGFVGAALCRRLLADGHRVISLDNYFTGSTERHLPGVEYRFGHTRDIAQHVPEQPDIVFHLGEYSRVEKSFEDPIQVVWDLNIAGTFSVLEFCRSKKTKLIYAGSSTKFADGGEGKSQSPYAWSKSANTELVCNYGKWFGLNFAITYFYNVYGEGEISSGPYATVIGIFKQLYARGLPLTVVSPGTQQGASRTCGPTQSS
jgi:UDP-glucose 4-epimerase